MKASPAGRGQHGTKVTGAIPIGQRNPFHKQDYLGPLSLFRAIVRLNTGDRGRGVAAGTTRDWGKSLNEAGRVREEAAADRAFRGLSESRRMARDVLERGQRSDCAPRGRRKP